MSLGREAKPALYLLAASAPLSINLAFGVSGFGLRVKGLGCRVWGAGFGVQGSRFRVQGRLRTVVQQPSVEDPGLRVEG